ncbi:unnamed protein product [Rotaria socialis]|uniref:Uncharacterized protein n=1 Tax=Rotaria socialis TaxID=392032 RepID=A0A820BKN3_9BILA|nr:unnamed protein product [Rotaria socialis]CAF3338500.1 unnamed protein product [Rotaria socialis]CAF3585846.1 unnamed protein product [Rotaria socialis]CAF3640421.1 unnamed protein product [Rotaria socialis]CAF3683936.1 unnamed protein product [Rotaria socialis]
MSHAKPSSPKKRSTHSAKRLDGSPRDGLTGMGPGTQMHFADVQAKMFDYIGEDVPWEEEQELDQSRRNQHAHHPKHQPQHHLHVPPPPPYPHHYFVDGAKDSKSRTKTPSPNIVRKHHTHTELPKKGSGHH